MNDDDPDTSGCGLAIIIAVIAGAIFWIVGVILAWEWVFRKFFVHG